MGTHIGRHWSAIYEAKRTNDLDKGEPTIEEGCPCPVEPCGLVDQDKVSPDCTQHTMIAAKTIRSSHSEEDCPSA